MFRILVIILFYCFNLYISAAAEQIDKTLLVPMRGDIVLGSEDAPSIIIEYSSFSCPLCARFHHHIFPEIDKQYLKTKKAKLIFRPFVMRPADLKASALFLCIPKEKHQTFLNVLFVTQKNWSFETSKQAETLEHLARLGGVDGAQIRKCLEDTKIEDLFIGIREKAQNKMSVNSAPTFFINGKKFVGTIGLEVFAQELS